MPSVQLDQINVVTPDMAGLVRFLRGLGVEVTDTPPEWIEWMDHHRAIASTTAGFDADLDSSAFAAHWGGLPPGWAGVVLGLRVTDRSSVDELYERAMASGAASLREPYDAFWGARAAFVEAAGGIVFGIMSPVDPQARSDSPDPRVFA
jgi:hypothetical protein